MDNNAWPQECPLARGLTVIVLEYHSSIAKSDFDVLTTPDGGEGRTDSGRAICGAFSMGVSLLPDGGREDSPSDW